MPSPATIEAVRTALAAEARIDLAHHPIAVGLEGGVLTVEGELASVAAKKLALERAAALQGVRGVVDRLRVAPASRMSDAEIRDHVCLSLLAEPALAACAVRARVGDRVRALRQPPQARGGVEVAVSQGVVALDGEVPGLCQRRLAGVLAWWVPGTRDVVNGLEVVPPEEDSDGEITDAVRVALEADPLLDSDRIRVSTRRAVVTLAGVVPSEVQRKVAEDDAWYILGVDEVENRIAVRA